ncbi:DUF3267 domain-containing protein [Tenacibaculum dicentrarchi]|nr:DUF3267 domain-containing protein [Tenacibaculum dicentrarchi]
MKKKTIKTSKANLFSLLFTVVIFVATILLYYLLWGDLNLEVLKIHHYTDIFIFLIIVFSSVLVHELIHAFVFAYFSKGNFKSVKIGVLWSQLTPYAHCKEALLVKHYKLAVIMPGIILGIVPIFSAILIESLLLLSYGIFMIMAAAGDFMIFILLMKVPKHKKILDHKSEMGFYIL